MTQPKANHTTDFSPLLMTNSMSADFSRRKTGGQRSCAAVQNFGRAGARPSSQKLFAHYSPLHIYTLARLHSYWLKPAAWAVLEHSLGELTTKDGAAFEHL